MSGIKRWPGAPDLFEEAREAGLCPKCGAAMSPIVYGMPVGGSEVVQQAKRGEVEIGGCIVWPEKPLFVCRGPKPHHWRRGKLGDLVECAG